MEVADEERLKRGEGLREEERLRRNIAMDTACSWDERVQEEGDKDLGEFLTEHTIFSL